MLPRTVRPIRSLPAIAVPDGLLGIWSAAATLAATDAATYQWWRLVQILCLISASVFALTHVHIGTVDAGSVAILVVFLAATIITTALTQFGFADRAQRAALLAIQTSSEVWKYAVGGGDYAVGVLTADEADAGLISALASHKTNSGLQQKMPAVALVVPQELQLLRNASLSERRARYIHSRLIQSMNELNSVASRNESWAGGLQLVVIVIQLVGIAVAAVQAFGGLQIDFFGALTSVAAGVTALLEARRHNTIATAARSTANELGNLIGVAGFQSNDVDWGAFVARSEGAIFARPVTGA